MLNIILFIKNYRKFLDEEAQSQGLLPFPWEEWQFIHEKVYSQAFLRK